MAGRIISIFMHFFISIRYTMKCRDRYFTSKMHYSENLIQIHTLLHTLKFLEFVAPTLAEQSNESISINLNILSYIVNNGAYLSRWLVLTWLVLTFFYFFRKINYEWMWCLIRFEKCFRCSSYVMIFQRWLISSRLHAFFTCIYYLLLYTFLEKNICFLWVYIAYFFILDWLINYYFILLAIVLIIDYLIDDYIRLYKRLYTRDTVSRVKCVKQCIIYKIHNSSQRASNQLWFVSII